MTDNNASYSSPRSAQSPRPSRFFGQFIVKHHFQFKFSLILFSILACSTVLLWLETHLVVEHLINTEVVKGDDAIEQLKILSAVVGRTSFITMAITFGLVLFLSHFVAGPLYRFEKTFQDMKNGNLAVFVKLREYDELKDVAEEFNQALSSVRFKLNKERDAVDASLAALAKTSSVTPEQIKEAMAAIKTGRELVLPAKPPQKA